MKRLHIGFLGGWVLAGCASQAPMGGRYAVRDEGYEPFTPPGAYPAVPPAAAAEEATPLASLEPGSRTFEISPRPGSLSWAKGAVATPHGPVQVSWSLEGKRLHIEAHAPQGVKLRFVTNQDLARLQIEKNF